MSVEEKLLADYIETIFVQSGNTKKLFILGFIGLNGVGKSYVASKIAEKLNLYIASNDHIRRFLNANGFEGASPAQNLVQEIAQNSTRYLFRNKISHILDADLIEFHSVARKIAKEHGARLLLIHLICPEDIILQRIRERSEKVQADSSLNLSRVGTERYFERKKMHETLPLPEIFFTIDTSKEIDLQVGELTNRLKEEQLI